MKLLQDKYEYAVEIIRDQNGAVPYTEICALLKRYGENGWKLVTAYSNELGRNSTSVNGFGTNSTEDQNIFIFERLLPVPPMDDPNRDIIKKMTINEMNAVDLLKYPCLVWRKNEKESKISLECTINKEDIRGILADVEVVSIFDEVYMLKDCAFLFESSKAFETSTSEEIELQIPEQIFSAKKRICVFIKKIVISEEVLDYSEKPVTDTMPEESAYDVLTEIADNTYTAEGIVEKIEDYYRSAIDTLPDGLMDDLRTLAKIEKMVGNRRDLCKKKIEEYFTR